jgi:DNA polymerase (family 10)
VLAAVEALSAHPAAEQVSEAGSVRRRRETFRDLDIIATATDAKALIDAFTGFEWVAEVVAKGGTKATVISHDGLRFDLRVVPPECYGNLLQHFTGSKNHNVAMREEAQRRGLSISEYGITEVESGEVHTFRTEDELYEWLGYQFIPPELRESAGELEAARRGELPALVEEGDLRGDLHAHTDWSDGRHPLDRLVAAAEARGYEYIIVSDHSKSTAIANGLDVDALRAQRRVIRELQPRFKIRILAGSECDILADGSMDFPDDVLDELDVVLAAVHSRFKQDRDAMTKRIVRALEHPHVDILVHPTGRRIGTREPYDVDLDLLFETAKRHGKALEINSSPERLDLSDVHARRAAERGIPIAISTDTHGLSELDHIGLGVTVARRAWIAPNQVLNTRTLDELLAWTKRAR